MTFNGVHSVNGGMNDGHYAEDAWAASRDFLTGPLNEMPEGTRQESLAPNPWIPLDETLVGLRAQLQDLRTDDNPVEGMETGMRQLFAAIRAEKVGSYLHDGDDAHALNDDSSSVAVDDHASVAASDGSEDGGSGDESRRDNIDIDTSAAARERQFEEDLQEIDATERAWMRLMAALRRIDALKGQPDTRAQLKEVVKELESMRGIFPQA
ncbi:hypothetical protein R3P38DRAFT_2810289 [Favolaschia claudopus]|uniref:Uncharacterized protein n=1 Tax=Favolaschia claudopus TaxID=2862362 RepID=A0AAV9ZC85_9AGAR